MWIWKTLLEYLLQVKIKIHEVHFFKPDWFSISFVSWPLFMNNKGYETKEIENQSEFKNFRVNLILTSEILN